MTDNDDVPCEVCGRPVETGDSPGGGMIIEFWNFLPEYYEHYGFCNEHKPEGEQLEEVKRRIKQGLNPVPGNND